MKHYLQKVDHLSYKHLANVPFRRVNNTFNKYKTTASFSKLALLKENNLVSDNKCLNLQGWKDSKVDRALALHTVYPVQSNVVP